MAAPHAILAWPKSHAANFVQSRINRSAEPTQQRRLLIGLKLLHFQALGESILIGNGRKRWTE